MLRSRTHNYNNRRNTVRNKIVRNYRISTDCIRDVRKIDPGLKNRSHYEYPVHVEPYHLPRLASEPILYVTPKADGIQVLLRIECTDFITVFQVELIGNTYHIIDLINLTDHNCSSMNFTERLKLISRLTGHIVYSDWNEKSDTDHRIDLGSSMFLQTKHVYTVHTNVNDLNDGTFLADLLKPHETSYPNDGWIVYTSSNTPIKFKPIESMTIDISYYDCGWYVRSDSLGISDHTLWKYDENIIDIPKGLALENGVYRCSIRTADHTTYIVPNQLRMDKTIPNSITRIRHILNRVQNDWDPLQIMKDYTRSDATYYEHPIGESQSVPSRIRTRNRSNFHSHILDIQSIRITKALTIITNILLDLRSKSQSLLRENSMISDQNSRSNAWEIQNVLKTNYLRVLDVGSGTCRTYSKLRQILNDRASYDSITTDTDRDSHINDCTRTDTDRDDRIDNRTHYDLEYYGLDNDPLILCSKYDAPRGVYRVWGDMNSLATDHVSKTILDYAGMIDLTICINSIHYAQDLRKFIRSVWSIQSSIQLQPSIQPMSSSDTSDTDCTILTDSIAKRYVMIFSMFSDLIDNNLSYVSPSNTNTNTSQWIVPIDGSVQSYEFTYPWRTTSFTEHIYSRQQIIDAVESIDTDSKYSVCIDRELTDKINHDISIGIIGQDLKLDPSVTAFLNMHECMVIKMA